MGDWDSSPNMDALLEQLGGCGRFQVILIAILNLASLPVMFGYMIDGYGVYNPGWRCLDDNVTIVTGNMTSHYNVSMTFTNTTPRYHVDNNTVMLSEYGKHSCDLYRSCNHVEFSPESSTYVTEWGLTCDRDWILSTILSLRMAGNLVSTFVAGYIGDRYGRRLPFLVAVVLQNILMNSLCLIPAPWQVYGGFMFVFGCLTSFRMLAGVIGFEYVSSDWRVKISSLPTWTIGSILFALTAMLLRDWRYLRVVITIIGVLVAFPLFWIPKSIRFLSASGNHKEFLKVVTRIARINRTEIPESFRGDKLNSLMNEINKNKEHIEMEETKGNKDGDTNQKQGMLPITKGTRGNKSYTILSLFRQKGFLVPTLVVGFVCLSIDLVYFVLSFGVVSLPGNIYINMIISSVTELPANLFSFFVANLFRRKPSIFFLFLLGSACLFGVVGMDLSASGEVKHVGTVSLVMAAKLLLYIAWIIMSTSISEIYPTVIRSTVQSYMWFASGMGGIAAPYLIPTNPDTFFVCYLSIAVLSVTCAGLVLLLPETKGKPLKDVWDDDDDDDDDSNNNDGDDDAHKVAHNNDDIDDNDGSGGNIDNGS